MKISFVIPAYNEEKYLGDCLRSVVEAVKEIPFPTEILVVNNASTDRTREVASGFHGVRVVDEPRKGLTRARQRGLESTTGELVANIDSDVRLPKEWPMKALRAFEEYPDLVCLSGPFIYYDLSAFTRAMVKIFYRLGILFYHTSRLIVGRGALVQGGNFILRRSALERIGGFDTNIEFFGEDTDIARRMSEVGRVEFISELSVLSSGRRLQSHGILNTGVTYALNYVWVTLFKRPLHNTYKDL